MLVVAKHLMFVLPASFLATAWWWPMRRVALLSTGAIYRLHPGQRIAPGEGPPGIIHYLRIMRNLVLVFVWVSISSSLLRKLVYRPLPRNWGKALPTVSYRLGKWMRPITMSSGNALFSSSKSLSEYKGRLHVYYCVTRIICAVKVCG